MRRSSHILPLVLLATVAVAAFSSGYGARLSFFDVTPEGRDFALTWQMEVEDQVREFEVQRRTPYSNDAFVKVHTVRTHGVGKAYLFRDVQVYKSGSEQLDYRLEAVYDNGLREVIATKSLNYTTTAVRRTWGSLKAMFQ